MWEFAAALDGYVRANSPSKGDKLTEQQKDDLFDWLEPEGHDAPGRFYRYRWDGQGVRVG